MKVSRRRSAFATPRAIYHALASNIAVATCKYIVALLTNSGTALAGAIHSRADCLNQLIMLYGHRRSHATWTHSIRLALVVNQLFGCRRNRSSGSR
ncbi:cation transporter [Paraburkholderia hospita]|uniref:cation transporter n=1 Tax=Paraburkholderia hospita TaxID=169430 RepID=UPI001EED3A86|nr:cation transporter [Paraburkholderia hospita]